MRPLLTIAAVAFLAAVTWWLVQPDVEFDDLGPGVRIVTRPGVDLILVGDAADRWRALPSSATKPRQGYPLPDGLRGWPAIDASGDVRALHADGVLRFENGTYVSDIDLPSMGTANGQDDDVGPIEHEALLLVGLDAAEEPVLLWRSGQGPRLFVRDESGQHWMLLEDADGPARGPERMSQVVLSPEARALAFRGDDGWEVWEYGSGQAQRFVADGCRGQYGVFTPDGKALIVDGKVKGLWRLELEDGSLRFMAEGNLGDHERIPFSVGFRGMELNGVMADVMVAPQVDQHGYLQIFQTHVSGGGRWSFGGGFEHHYAPSVSPDGRFLAYVQAKFEKGAGDALRENLYLFDFDTPGDGAIHLGSRAGGRPGQGPAFAGAGDVLVFIAQGHVQRLSIAER